MENEELKQEIKLRRRKRTILVLIILILIILLVRCGMGCESKKSKAHGSVSVPIEILLRGQNGSGNEDPVTPPDEKKEDNRDTKPVTPPDKKEDSGNEDPDEKKDSGNEDPDEKKDSGNEDPEDSGNENASAVLIELEADDMKADKESAIAEEMYPGDSFTKFYCIRLTCDNPIKLKFYAMPQLDQEDLKLIEVLKIKATVWSPDSNGKYTNSEVIYDGLIRDMKASVEADPSKYLAQSSGETDYFYELTIYLDTSVGNEYQNRSLLVDFNWELVE